MDGMYVYLFVFAARVIAGTPCLRDDFTTARGHLFSFSLFLSFILIEAETERKRGVGEHEVKIRDF